MQEDDNGADYEALLAAGQENARYKRMMQQQKSQADYMRANSDPGQGQMISGHYVAPHALQRLSGLTNAAGAAYTDKQAEKSGAGLDASMGSQNALILKALMRNRSASKQSPYTGMQFDPNADTRDVTPGMDY